MTDAHRGEAKAISDTKAKIGELEKNFQVEIKDLKAKANSRI